MTVLKMKSLPNQDWIDIDYIYPPVPSRQFNFCAYVHGSDGKDRVCGWGSSQFHAVLDLYNEWEADAFTDNEPFIVHRMGFMEDLT